MSPTIIGLLGLIAFFIFMLLGIPVSYAMIIIGFIGITILRSFTSALGVLSTEIFNTFSSYSFSVIPMFTLMGFIAYYSGIGGNLFNLVHKLIGHYRGGLAFATKAACALFGAVCGSAFATVATMGVVAYPEMAKANYDKSFSLASIAAGASLASLIPPSVAFILYGIITEQSIGRLFMAGIIPGIMHMLLYILLIHVVTYYYKSWAPAIPKASWKERWEALLGASLVETLIIFCLSLGGLFMGWFTPTEAGGVGAISLLLLTIFKKRISFADFKKALLDTTRTTAMIFLLIAGALVLGRFFALTRIPFELCNWVSQLQAPPFVILGIIIFIYFVLGFFIDMLALILLTVPFFYPVITQTLGYSPIWFGVIILLCISMGSATPPVGINVYIVKSAAPEVPIEKIFEKAFYFLIADVALIIILIIFPKIATILPDLLY